MIHVTLPLPPSVNSIWSHGSGGVFRSRLYKKWRETAGWTLQAARQKRGEGPYKMTLFLPADMAGDIDNRIKVASDLLVEHRLIDDDRHAQTVLIMRDSGAASSPATRRTCAR